MTPLESTLHFFGAELRHWRTMRGLSQTALGRRTHDSGALIGKVEKGERFPSLALARRLDVALDTGGALERLWPHLEHERATRDDCGDVPASGGESGPGDLGLAWPATPQATVDVVVELWKRDLNRRSALASAAWVAAAFAGPTREWLLNRQDEVLHDRSGRAVGQRDVDAVWAMCDAFTAADRRLGGGYARSTLLHYINQVVLPLLQGNYRDTIGRELMAAVVRSVRIYELRFRQARACPALLHPGLAAGPGQREPHADRRTARTTDHPTRRIFSSPAFGPWS